MDIAELANWTASTFVHRAAKDLVLPLDNRPQRPCIPALTTPRVRYQAIGTSRNLA